VNRVLWALCVYVEAVSVLPQLRMMQKAKVTLDPGPWTLDPGPWTLDPGPWTLDPGPWTLDP
jgi:hypothetical protein